ncbi:hypothetical protein ACOMHN_017335 [Nucella lapillus]
MTPDSAGVAKVTRQYRAGDPVYALYYGPRRDKHPRWVPAVIKKSLGTRCFNVKVISNGPLWRRHWEQLQPRYTSEEDNEPVEAVDNVSEVVTDHPMEILDTVPQTQRQTRTKTLPPVPEIGHVPRLTKHKHWATRSMGGDGHKPQQRKETERRANGAEKETKKILEE